MNKTTKGLTNIMCSRFLFVYVMFLLFILFEVPNITAVDTTRRVKRTQTINVGVERDANTEDIYYSEVRMTAQSVKRVSEGPEEVPYELCWSVFIVTNSDLYLTPTVSIYPNDGSMELSGHEVYIPRTSDNGITVNFAYNVKMDDSTANGGTVFVCGVNVRR